MAYVKVTRSTQRAERHRLGVVQDEQEQTTVHYLVTSETANRMGAWELLDFADALRHMDAPTGGAFVELVTHHSTTGHLTGMRAQWTRQEPSGVRADQHDVVVD
jgi:hypothetical protein